MEVLSENWDALRAFLAAQTQWRVGATGMLGLDYTAVRLAVKGVAADGLGLAREGRRLRWRDVFSKLQVLEAAALEEFGRLRRNRGSS